MHILIPFPMDTIQMSFGKPEAAWGRDVASFGFLRALAAVSDEHRISVWVPTAADATMLGRTLLADIDDDLEVVTSQALRPWVAANVPDVVHVLDPNLWLGGHLRGQLAAEDVVVTGMTHSLANQHFLDWGLLNSANGIDERDCLVCTTPTALKAVRSMFDRLRAGHSDFRAPVTEVIPLGLDIDQHRRAASVDRRAFGLDDADFVVLSLARFNPAAKMDLLPLLNLMQMLPDRNSRRIRLVVSGSAGDGAYEGMLRDQITRRGLDEAVIIVASPSDEHKLALFQHADAFLSLSDNLQETFGLTVIEALASGLPVIASDWDGYRALITHGENGFLVPTKMLDERPDWEAVLSLQPDPLAHLQLAQTTAIDLPATVEALLTLAEDSDLRERMGRAAADSAERFDWPVIIGQYLTLWERLIESRDQHPRPAVERSSAIRFLADFAGYPTSQIADHDRFIIADMGRRLLSGQASVTPYAETSEMLDFGLLSRLLQACEQERSVEALCAELCPEGKTDERLQLIQNILWLYKYGYLENCR